MTVSNDTVLHPDAICLGVDIDTASGVIGLLAARLEALGKVRSSYAGAVIERERTMPTGLPLGRINVAVPHTDSDHVIAPALAVATLRKPVPFGSMDDPEEMIPVRVVVAMALTDKNAQLAMLQRIASFIQNEDALTALVAATAPAEAIAAFGLLGKV